MTFFIKKMRNVQYTMTNMLTQETNYIENHKPNNQIINFKSLYKKSQQSSTHKYHLYPTCLETIKTLNLKLIW